VLGNNSFQFTGDYNELLNCRCRSWDTLENHHCRLVFRDRDHDHRAHDPLTRPLILLLCWDGHFPPIAGYARDLTGSAAAPLWLAGAMSILAGVCPLQFRLVQSRKPQIL
jgi:hypothetical protein